MTFDELISMIREAAYADDQTCRFFADELQKLVTECAAGPWIPVGERLPEMGKAVLISDAQDGMRVSCAYSYRAGETHWEDDRECGGLFHVTHWAELRGPK